MNHSELLKAEATKLRNQNTSLLTVKEDKALRKKLSQLDKFSQILERMTIEQIAEQIKQCKSKIKQLDTPERRSQWAGNNQKECANKSHTSINSMFRAATGLSKIIKQSKEMEAIIKTVKELSPATR